MLIGEYKNTIDEKGRITFPAKLKKQLENEELIITAGMDGNLLIMDKVNFKIFSNNIGGHKSSIFNGNSRLLQRRLIGRAQFIELDKSNRFLIPPNLRDIGSLSVKQEAIFVGLSDYIELWNAEKYEKYLEETESEFNIAANEIGKFLEDK